MPKLSGIKIGISSLIVILALAVLGLASSSAKVAARDRHRLADVQKIYEALKIFYEENGYYPYGSGTAEPTGLSNYLDGWPVSPPSGKCPNTYIYNQKSQSNSYELSFCLDRSEGGFGPGSHTINP